MELVNRGGVIVRVGRLPGFIPFSMLDPARLSGLAGGGPPAREGGGDGAAVAEQLAGLVGATLRARVVEAVPEKRTLILSERAAVLSERAARLKVVVSSY